MLELVLGEVADYTREEEGIPSRWNSMCKGLEGGTTQLTCITGAGEWGSWKRGRATSSRALEWQAEELGHTLLVLAHTGLWLLEEGQGLPVLSVPGQ